MHVVSSGCQTRPSPNERTRCLLCFSSRLCARSAGKFRHPRVCWKQPLGLDDNRHGRRHLPIQMDGYANGGKRDRRPPFGLPLASAKPLSQSAVSIVYVISLFALICCLQMLCKTQTGSGASSHCLPCLPFVLPGRPDRRAKSRERQPH